MQTDSTSALKSRSLRAAREAKGMSLRAAAARSGIDPGHLSKVERGEKQLSLEALYRLAVVVDLDELAGHLKPLLPEEIGAGPACEAGPSAGNDEEAACEAASPVEQSAPHAK
ncbi:helix-turn-helix transcriptional regulator [Streptomyces sp. DH24]|uniref:helix-turn-helix domain-containing protein n=1 Tax=Streptomyces sp. DH24 TaxID=3040123 RepID=UPI00244314D7|nr:helix-turn-helix transcriptional regulator [Streptomyces sp. DH24]MDG9717440.1 helix-turn-helix transcriptional regulator [Streptomyces sp. DH24]